MVSSLINSSYQDDRHGALAVGQASKLPCQQVGFGLQQVRQPRAAG
jgi:hypothetical protein